MEIALVVNNRIENVIIADSVQWAVENLGGEWVDLTGLPGVGIGWTRDQGVWSPPTAVVTAIPPAVLEANAVALANKIALQKSVEADLETLSDDDLATITYLFPEWVGDGRVLALEAKVRYNGILYRVIQAHNTQAGWTPDAVPALFTPFRETAGANPDPWAPPTGAQDDYDIGDRVTHDNPNDGGAIWIYESAINGNTTEPGRDGTFDRWWTPISVVA